VWRAEKLLMDGESHPRPPRAMHGSPDRRFSPRGRLQAAQVLTVGGFPGARKLPPPVGRG